MAKVVIKQYEYDLTDEQGQVNRFSETKAYFICPGCHHVHAPVIQKSDNSKLPLWGFNWNRDKPTFTPSILVSRAVWEGDEVKKDAQGNTVMEAECHTFINDGRIQFLSDCKHELANQTVELPDIPDDHWLYND